jgi:hypothetical protein
MEPFKKYKSEREAEKAFDKHYKQVIAKRKKEPEKVDMIEYARGLMFNNLPK